jgi:2,3-dihydroxyphenylpropionate 1,2-dioxygenase
MPLRPLGLPRGSAVAGALADARNAVESFAPDVVIVFTPDHYNGFFYDLMPPFCIGAGARGVGDFGTSVDPLYVDSELARRLHEGCFWTGW